LEMQCQRLTDLVRTAARQIEAVRTWAERDGIAAPRTSQQGSRTQSTSLLATMARIVKVRVTAGTTSEETDPDLTFAMQRVLAVGQQLEALRHDSFCARPPTADDDDDDDDDDEDEDEESPAAAPAAAPASAIPAAHQNSTGSQVRVGNASSSAAGLHSGDSSSATGLHSGDHDHDHGDDTEDEEPEQPDVNGSAVTSLLAFDEDMKGAVDKFETGVHPHGKKWWRYRYEYTLVESFVLAFSVVFLFFVMWLLHGVSFFGKFKFYNIGVPARLNRYAWGYFVFHAAALMVMVCLAYMLYMPWGKNNIFDVCAKALHGFIDGRANVPILGKSWLFMALDVQFQLFACFAFYGMFICFVIVNFQRALDDWKALSDDDESGNMLPINVELYNTFNNILSHRVRKSASLHQAFKQMKLRLANVDGLDRYEEGWTDFSLHLYLTDSLGKALEYLVEVSLKSNLFIAASALVVALLAHVFKVAFMYFLPLFVAIGFVLFIVGFYAGYRLRKSSKDHDHDKPLKFVNVHSYCRAIQIVMYCVFFSFSRLLLSNDIFTDYPKVYLAAALGLAFILLLAWFMAGEIMKETLCAIVLPPQIDPVVFKKNLQLVVNWHTTENCHECGVTQHPRHASCSRTYAGIGSRGGVAPSSPGDTSRRPFSWRG